MYEDEETRETGRTFGDEVDGGKERGRIAEKRGKANKGRTVARL